MSKIIDYASKYDVVESTSHTAILPDTYASTDQLLVIVVKDANTGDMTLEASSITAGWQIAQADEARRSSRMLIVSAPGTVTTEPIITSTDIDAWGSMSFAIRHGSSITSSNISSADPVGFLNENASNAPFHKFSGITTTGKNSLVFWVGTTTDDALSPQPGWGVVYGPNPIKNAKTLIAVEAVSASADGRPSPYWHSGDSNTWGSFDMDQCVFEIVDINQSTPEVAPCTSGGPRGDIKKILELFCYTQSTDGGDPWSVNPTRVTDPTNGDHLPVPPTINGLAVDYIESGTPEFAGGSAAKRRVLNSSGFYLAQSSYLFETPAVAGSMGAQQIDFAWPLGSVDRVTPNTPYSVDFSSSLNKMILFNFVVDDPADRDMIGTIDEGGVYFYVVDGSGNWRAWMVYARHDLRQDSSWNRSYVLDVNDTASMIDESASPIDVSNIVSCGVGVHAVGGEVGHFLSRFYVVEPWTTYGGNSSNPCSIENLLDYQDGCFCKVLAVQGTNTLYQGILQIGDGAASTYNVESEVTYECQELYNTSIPDIGYHVREGISGIIFNLTANCTVNWTDVILTAKNPQRFEFMTSLGSVTFSSCIFRRCNPAEIVDGHVFNSCVFDRCGSVAAGAPDAKDCTFKNCAVSGAGALKIQSSASTALNNLTGVQFIDNLNALEITQPGTYTLTDVIFSGNTVDIINSSGGAVVINAIGSSNPSTTSETSGGTTTIVPQPITLKVIVKDQSGVPVAGALAYIDNDNASPYIMNTTTDSNGEASVSHADGPIAGTTWRVRKYGFRPFKATVDVGTIDISLPVTLITAPQQT